MKYTEYIENSFRLLFCKEEALTSIVNENKAFLYGIITLLIAGVTTSFYSFNILTYLFNILSLLGIVVIGFFFYYLLAVGIFSSQAKMIEYSKALLAPLIIYWVAIIPVIGFYVEILGSLWFFIVNIFLLRKLHKLSTGKAVILGLLPLILLFAYLIIVGNSVA